LIEGIVPKHGDQATLSKLAEMTAVRGWKTE